MLKNTLSIILFIILIFLFESISVSILFIAFEKFSLQGTPSTILVDRKGILRDVSFGQSTNVEALIQKLLDED